MFQAKDLAIYIINRVHEMGKEISNLQLQKILYYAQGYYSAVKDSLLFEDNIFAWMYGPVVPEVYNEYSIFSAGDIIVWEDSPKIDIETKRIIDYVISEKIDIDPWVLVEETHKEDPWRIVNSIYGDKAPIPQEFITKYFKSKIKEL